MFRLPILEMSLGLGSSVELELRASYLTAQRVGDGEGVEDSESLPWTSLRPSVTGRLSLSSWRQGGDPVRDPPGEADRTGRRELGE